MDSRQVWPGHRAGVCCLDPTKTLVCMSAPQCLCCSLSLQLSLWAVYALVQGESCVARVRGLGSWPSRSADGGWYCLLSVGGSTEEDETHGGGSWIPPLQPL